MAPASVVVPVPNDEDTRDRDTEVGSNDEEALGGKQVRSGQERTPLPVLQLFVLCLMRFSEPISFLVVS